MKHETMSKLLKNTLMTTTGIWILFFIDIWFGLGYASITNHNWAITSVLFSAFTLAGLGAYTTSVAYKLFRSEYGPWYNRYE